MIYFLDASALAKRYLREPGTERVRQLFRRNAEIASGPWTPSLPSSH